VVSLRAIALGAVVLPPVALLAALRAPPTLLVVGFVPGAVAAAFAPPGARSGAVHGAVTGAVVTLGTWLALFAWLTVAPPDRVAPGFGLSLVLLAALALAAGVQSTVSGGVVGLLR
jgi:Na+/proline symporter